MSPAQRRIALVVVLALYGAASLPAPPRPGLIEAAIAGLLVAAVGIDTLLRFGSGQAIFRPAVAPLDSVGAACLHSLVWFPLLIGVIADHALREISRDLVPLGYLFLPALLMAGLCPPSARGETAAGHAAAAVRWEKNLSLRIVFLMGG